MKLIASDAALGMVYGKTFWRNEKIKSFIAELFSLGFSGRHRYRMDIILERCDENKSFFRDSGVQ